MGIVTPKETVSTSSTPHILILGSGIGGLCTALHLTQHAPALRVTLVSKGNLEEGATRYAQGGIASVWERSDSFAAHIQDTLQAGDGLCHQDAVRLCVQEGPTRVRELLDWGVAFDRDALSGKQHLHKEGGHSEPRILHVADATGNAIEQALINKLKTRPGVQILEHHYAIDLISEGKISGTPQSPGRILGAYIFSNPTQNISTILADATVLATGGAGKAYLYTSNPDSATGDGIAMAYRAGANIANLEFMQFHPTCLYSLHDRTFLITEALRGEGAELLNARGEAFMSRYHSQGALAPRDHVARAIDTEIKKAGIKHVWLDCAPIVRSRGAQYLKTQFPNIDSVCKKNGIDFTQDRIPVVPAAHYMCGGVQTDLHGQSTLPGLYAVGEVACTGLHGANRLASNSLLEAVVFAKQVADHILKTKISSTELERQATHRPPRWDSGKAVSIEEQVDLASTWLEIRTLLWNAVGIVRNSRRLLRAQRRLDLIGSEIHEDYWRYHLTPELLELRNLHTVAELIVLSAQNRKESRGLHYTTDYPNRGALTYDTVIHRRNSSTPIVNTSRV